MLEKIKKKYAEWKEKVKNPPPDRLAKIEYQSHFLQMAGVVVASVILFIKGLWFIIFALIFSLGINYSQGMSALKKYQQIKKMMPREKPEDYQKDISPSRRRGKIIRYVFGSGPKWFSTITSVVAAYLILGTSYDSAFLMSLYYLLVISVTFIILYFVIFFKVAQKYYKKKIEDGDNN